MGLSECGEFISIIAIAFYFLMGFALLVISGMESFIQLDNFYLQSVSLATMVYCIILYLVSTVILATVIRVAELKKCLMVMFGMDLIVRIGVMTAGCLVVTDMKVSYRS